MSGISISYPGIDTTFARQFPHNKTQYLHSEPIHLEWSIQAVLPSKNSIIMECGSSSLKKTRAEAMKKKKTRPISPLKRVEIRGSKDQNSLSVSPFPPSPLNISPFKRSGFDRVPTSYEPLFGSATQVTKVCYTLPTQNSTYQPYSRKKMVKLSNELPLPRHLRLGAHQQIRSSRAPTLPLHENASIKGHHHHTW